MPVRNQIACNPNQVLFDSPKFSSPQLDSVERNQSVHIRFRPSVAKAEISEAELRLVESILPEIILAMTAQNDAS